MRPQKANRASSNEYLVIGTRPPRYDAVDKVTGRARYGPDISLPGLLHGKILRSPHAHARIRSIDTSRAQALPGVHAVVTAGDLPGAGESAAPLSEEQMEVRYRRDNTLASDKVLYVGHAVAAVAATTAEIAEQALELIHVDYVVLPAVMEMMAAAHDSAVLLRETLGTESWAGDEKLPPNVSHHFQQAKGNPEKGFAEADVIVEREFRTATVHQGYLEPHAATALWSSEGRLTVYTSTQGAFAVRDQLAELLHLPMSRILVVPTEVGGAFGGKNSGYVDAVAALLSLKTGHPVKLVMTQAEVFRSTGPTPGTVIRVKMGATQDGRIAAAQAELYYDAGAYPESPIALWSGVNGIFGGYDIPHARVDGYNVVTNKPRSTTYRAPGATPACFACEQVIDELAGRMSIDPLEFRLRNCAREGTQQINGQVHPPIGAYQVLEAARDCPHYSAPLKSPHRGRGVGYGFWRNWGGRSSSAIIVNEDGTVNLVTGSIDITGTRTSIAMQAAEALGIALEQVRSRVGDTDSVAYADVSAGSRTTVATGIAVVAAAGDVISQMRARAAMLWAVPVDTVSYGQSVFTTSQDSDKHLSFAELAAQLSRTGGAVTGVGNVDVQEWGTSFGAHIADVEVDPETGKVTLLRYTIVQDVGTAVHPTQVEGQMQGGATQGIGWALYEGYEYDQNGEMLNPSFLDYRLPTALDVPALETIIVEVPYPKHPYGARGAGEMPIVPAPAAIANAIYRATGVRVRELPMTPARILENMGVI